MAGTIVDALTFAFAQAAKFIFAIERFQFSLLILNRVFDVKTQACDETRALGSRDVFEYLLIFDLSARLDIANQYDCRCE